MLAGKYMTDLWAQLRFCLGLLVTTLPLLLFTFSRPFMVRMVRKVVPL